ncbi:MAG: hypothetical protein H0T46_34905 [Deltaproteobacteria bacterium]|nr:hypothetical protein [Deltaproteobacteria bacterium]
MRTTALVVAVLAFGCGKKGDDKQASEGTPSVKEPVPTAPANQEKGPPPKEEYKGKNRLVNLYIGADGKTQTVDVWVRRGFKWGPVKLAENVEFGKVSAWFGVPSSMSPVVLPVGAKADDKELSGMVYGRPDEVVTGVLTTYRGQANVVSLYDVSKEMTQAVKPPSAGKGTIILDAGQLQSYEAALTEKYGGRSFNVGDGTGECRPQRDPKMADLALGGTASYELELPPGKAKVTLHKWPAPADGRCKAAAVYELEVEAIADKAQRVFIYTPDSGKSLATLVTTVNE